MISEKIDLSNIFAISKSNQPVLSASKPGRSFASVFYNSMKKIPCLQAALLTWMLSYLPKLQRVKSDSQLQKLRINTVRCAVPELRKTAPAPSALCPFHIRQFQLFQPTDFTGRKYTLHRRKQGYFFLWRCRKIKQKTFPISSVRLFTYRLFDMYGYCFSNVRTEQTECT